MIGFEPSTVARHAAYHALRHVAEDGSHFKPLERYRTPLRQARNLLDAACRLFEHDMFLDEHDAFYLPLFDSLTLANVACSKRKVHRTDLHKLRAMLTKVMQSIPVAEPLLGSD